MTSLFDGNMKMITEANNVISDLTLKLLQQVTGINSDNLRETTPFVEINLESLAITAFVSKLETYFPTISKTFIFDCRNLDDVNRYLKKNHEIDVNNYISELKPNNLIENEVEQKAPELDFSVWPEIEPIRASTNNEELDAVAIIGMDGIFPGSNSLDEFWHNLYQGKDSISEIPHERWPLNYFYAEGTESRKSGLSYAKWGGFVSNVDRFDAQFFGISAREADQMDPQERLFLQCAWHAMENAALLGERANNLKNGQNYNVGVFVGLTTNTYNLLTSDHWRNGGRDIPASVPWSSANRVSFALNLNGPSLAVDTACSSSLVALHLACESILKGECLAAIAGGVNLYLHPAKYIQLCQLQMLSPTGRCHSFGSEADGFVPGEGCGAVVLKSLAKAKADGDCILGIIRGTAVNHSGRTNGYTVPDAQSQSQLLQSALKRFKLEPSSIGYIEAHGTGTKLGDPIEFSGFTDSLAGTTSATPCGVGSVKTNIGHLESAAGIAGVIKVLLQLKNKYITPSLGSKQLNPALDISNSRFFVPQSPISWQPDPHSGVRRAGISSFGAGGTNGHVVIEEAPVLENDYEGELNKFFAFPISAKSSDQLNILISDLIYFIESDKYKNNKSSFYSLAYVLQTGRQHFPFRYVVVAKNNDELIERLKKYTKQPTLSDSSPLPTFFTSHIRPDEESELDDLTKDAFSLAKLWSSGVKVNWQKLWEVKPEIIALPQYPFAMERHWISNEEETLSMPGGKTVELKQNNQFQTFHYSGKEYYLNDHQINGSPIFPAAAYINCFYKLIKDKGMGEQLNFQNITWANPFRPDGLNIDTMIGKVSENSDIQTLEFSSPNEKIIYCRTRCKKISNGTIPSTEKLAFIQQRCKQEVIAQDCYPRFEMLGMNYGPSFRCMSSAWIGDNEALVKVVNSTSNLLDEDSVLEPGMLDSIFQSTFIFNLMNKSVDNIQYIPYSIKSFRIFERLSDTVYVHVRPNLHRRTDNSSVFDLTIYNTAGQLLIEIDEFSFRTFSKQIETVNTRGEQEILVYIPDWEEILSSEEEHRTETTLLFDDDSEFYNFICQTYPESKENIWLVLPGERFQFTNENKINLNANEPVHLELLWKMFNAEQGMPNCILFNGDNFTKDNRQQDLWETKVGLNTSKTIIEIIRSACVASSSPRFHIQINKISDTSEFNIFTAPIAGYLRAVHQEIPTITANLVNISTDTEYHYWAHELFQSSRAGIQEINRKQDKRLLQVLKQSDSEFSQKYLKPTLDENDVIVITGGGGAIAKAITYELIKVTGIKLALIGRTDEISLAPWINQLLDKDGQVKYWQTDCSDREQLNKTLNSIRETFGPISGVLHCAGVLKDAFFLRQEPTDWKQVLEVKVLGTTFLDELTQTDSLKWFVMCSALAGVRGNIGQSIYGFANAWLNVFAEQRNIAVKNGLRSGSTKALAWSLWNTTNGMQPPQSIVDRYAKKGLVALTEQEGVELFLSALNSPQTVLIPIKGNKQSIEEFMGSKLDTNKAQKEASLISEAVSYVPFDEAEHKDSNNIDVQGTQPEQATLLIEYLKTQLSKVTGTDIEKIDPEISLEAFGLDSILVMELNDLLEKEFPKIPKTLLFEARNLKLLANLLIEEHREEADKFHLTELAKNKAKSILPNSSLNESLTLKEDSASKLNLISSEEAFSNQIPVEMTGKGDRIAIVGIAGRYPGSSDINNLWEHLSKGHDLISEIPGRWSLQNEDESLYAKWGGFIDNFDCFDPLFFGISPRDAERMDPQERLFLQTAWHTIENAGYTPETLSGDRNQNSIRRRVGVIVGVMYGEYQLYGAANNANVSLTNSSYASIANRVSYCLDLDGPSFAIDSMCSSSLTSISLACDYLRNGRSDAMIAGGVNLSIHPNKYRLLCELNFASSDGRCRSFGEGGDGYVPGEGVGAVLLKRLEDAERDGDFIYAVIQGSELGHGAKTSGYTVPNAEAQTDVVRRAFERSGVSPSRLSYVEAHGTGTSLGDPIEIRGLTKALASDFETNYQCAVGSIKSNIGHLESAAGIAALTKVLLQLQHDKLVPSIHSDTLNKNIDFSKTPFFIQRHLSEWKREDQLPRIAAISSFGAGGANAHLVLEEYQYKVPNPQFKKDKELFVFSARSKAQLFKILANFITYLDREMLVSKDGNSDFVAKQKFTITDVAMTLLHGRRHFRIRLALIAENFSQLKNALQHFLNSNEQTDILSDIGAVQQNDCLYGDIESPNSFPQLETENFNELTIYAQSWITNKKELNHLNATGWRKVPLPGYEFLQNRYWFSTEQKNVTHEVKYPNLEQSKIDDQNVVPLRPEVILERVSKGEMDREEARSYLQALSKK